MKVAFIWDWDNEVMHMLGWRDGLAAALNILQTKCDLKIYTQARNVSRETIFPHEFFDIFTYPDPEQMSAAIRDDDPDVLLFWADMTRPAIPMLAKDFPSACCFSGGFAETDNTDLFKLMFIESESYREVFEKRGIKTVQAFGCNTELFQPQQQPKVWDVFFPATFAAWKRHDLFAASVSGFRAYACGWPEPHEPWCHEVCREGGVFTTHHMMPYLLPDMYSASKMVLITSGSNGGSQRTVLEAMAMNIPCIVMADSDKCSEYLFEAGYPDMIIDPNVGAIRAKIEETLEAEVNTRDWVLENYSEHVYAQKLYDGLCELNS